jgi:hypothetical protein
MKQKTFILRDEKVIAHLIAFINAQPKEPVIEVVVREHKKKREVIQNSLYWRWITHACEELGMLKEDLHVDLKKRLLVPIYERDDEEYCDMILALRKLYTDGYKEDSQKLFDQVVKLTSTTSATVKQFAEYLREFERDMAGNGIVLPHKEDEYYDSLMIKR